jgi:hypothetical protein
MESQSRLLQNKKWGWWCEKSSSTTIHRLLEIALIEADISHNIVEDSLSNGTNSCID